MNALLWLAGAYLAFMNLWLFAAMGYDKRRAVKGKWRTPEAKLLTLAALGGSLGGILGMRLFRHKTRKPAFALGFPAIFAVQLLLAALALWKSGVFPGG